MPTDRCPNGTYSTGRARIATLGCVVSVSVTLPLQALAQTVAPIGSGALPAQPRAPAIASSLPRNGATGLALSVVGGLVSAAGVGLSAFNLILFPRGPIDPESYRLKTCCPEQAFFAPGFLAMAGGGVMLGYGVDSARRSGWDATYVDSRTGLIVSGALLGTAVALYAISAALYAGTWSEVGGPNGPHRLTDSGERMLQGSRITLGLSYLMAFPTGMSAGAYLNRYLRERNPPSSGRE